MYITCVLMYVSAYMCTGTCEDPRLILGVFLCCFPLYFLGQELSWNTELAHQPVFEISVLSAGLTAGLPCHSLSCFISACL